MTLEPKMIDIQLDNPNEAMELLGISDNNLKALEHELDISIITRGGKITVGGEAEAAEKAYGVIKALLAVIRRGIKISARDVMYAISLAEKGTLEYFTEMYDEEIAKINPTQGEVEKFYAEHEAQYTESGITKEGKYVDEVKMRRRQFLDPLKDIKY